MSSNTSCSSEEGDFFDSLEKSLTQQYSYHMLTDFILNLLDAINNLDDNPEDGFCFYDNDEYNDVDEYFQTSSSDGAHNKENAERRKNKANLSEEMFDESDGTQDVIMHERDGETDNVSVDMFAEFENESKVVDAESEHVDRVTFNGEGMSETTPTNHLSVRLCHVSNDIVNVENEECQQLRGTITFEHAENQELSQELPKLKEPPSCSVEKMTSSCSVDRSENEEQNESINMILCLPSSDICSINEHENSGNLNPELITSHSVSKDALRSSIIGSDINGFSPQKTMPLTGFSPVASNINLAVPRTLPQSMKILPRNVDNIGSDLNTTICEEYETARNFVPQFSTCSPRDGNSTGSDLNVTVCEEYETPRNFVPQFSSDSPRGGNNVGSDINTTVCEEYDTTRNFLPQVSFNFEEAYTQCFSESVNENSDANQRQKFIDEIEKLIFKLGNDLVCGRQLLIEVPYKVAWDNCIFEDERLILKPLQNGQTRKIASKRKISMILYVLSFISKLLLENTKCTKREIYYSDPEFTQNQQSVDDAIRDICLILNARPWEINILSSSKGLIAGSIRLTLNDDTILDVGSIDGGILLPHLTTSVKKVETAAKFVMLVEKHTIYEKLLGENILNQLAPCVLITGKGYPDINTKAILKRIWEDCKCPIYALVDADPYGIEIMLSYRHGSLNMSYGNEDLAIPSIRWIGVYPSEIKNLRLQSLPLTKEDLCRIDSMIKRPYISKKVYKELLVMKRTLQKSEVESLTASGINDWINSYLRKKIESGVFI